MTTVVRLTEKMPDIVGARPSSECGTQQGKEAATSFGCLTVRARIRVWRQQRGTRDSQSPMINIVY